MTFIETHKKQLRRYPIMFYLSKILKIIFFILLVFLSKSFKSARPEGYSQVLTLANFAKANVLASL